MSDTFRIDVEADAVIAALTHATDAARPYVNEASHVTADAFVAEARARLERALGPTQTPTASRPDLGQGLTLAGLQALPAPDGNGYLVVDGREPFRNVPLWEEKGTKHGEPAHPFFYVSGRLQVDAHERRLADALQEAFNAEGLGQ